MPLHRDCNAMGDASKISLHVPSTCAHNAILSLLIIHLSPSCQIHVAIENPSLVLSVFCLNTSSYLWSYVCAANDVSHAENCKTMAAGACLIGTNFEIGSKLPQFSGIVESARANQYSTKAPFLFRSLILNIHCSCHGRCPSSAPYYLPGRCFTHTQSCCQSPLLQLWLPVHRHIWDMSSPSTPSTWTLIPWEILRSIVCGCASDI